MYFLKPLIFIFAFSLFAGQLKAESVDKMSDEKIAAFMLMIDQNEILLAKEAEKKTSDESVRVDLARTKALQAKLLLNESFE